MKGNFVVKRSPTHFNQVDPDQAQEWLNGTGKRGGGIVGITQSTTTALSRWTLSYNLRSQIASDTYAMYNLFSGNIHLPESGTSRQNRDRDDENSVFTTFQRFSRLKQRIIEEHSH